MRKDLADMEFVPRGLYSIQPGRGCKPPLRDWLVERGLLREGQVKPDRPKEAFLAALQEAGKPRTHLLYRQLAKEVSLRRCRDAAFGEFKDIMRGWFPVD